MEDYSHLGQPTHKFLLQSNSIQNHEFFWQGVSGNVIISRIWRMLHKSENAIFLVTDNLFVKLYEHQSCNAVHYYRPKTYWPHVWVTQIAGDPKYQI